MLQAQEQVQAGRVQGMDARGASNQGKERQAFLQEIARGNGSDSQGKKEEDHGQGAGRWDRNELGRLAGAWKEMKWKLVSSPKKLQFNNHSWGDLIYHLVLCCQLAT